MKKKTSRFLSILLTLCMIFGMFPGTVLAAQEDRFSDVDSGAWYAEAVKYVFEKGLMSGTGDGSFSPEGTMSRAMIVTILYGMEGRPAVKGGSFYDVPKDQWYADAVSWASTNGIVSGYGGSLFGPNDLITREQMAAILYSYAKFKGYDVSAGDKVDLTVYSDYDKLAAWAIPGMQWACGVGLISGVGGGALAPQGGATRGQAAVIFRSMDVNVVEVEKTKAEAEKKDEEKKPGSLSGGSSGGGFVDSKIQLTDVKVMLGDTNMTGKIVNVGDTLSFYTIPADTTCTVAWKVGGVKVSDEDTYTVKELDVGKTITVTVTGTGSYTGTVGATTGMVVTIIDPYSTGFDTKTYTQVEQVNRGLGQITFLLTDGKDSEGNPLEDFMGNVDGYVDWDWENGGYMLRLTGDFYGPSEVFWMGEGNCSRNDYETLQLVISPFEGESFTKLPTVRANYWTDYWEDGGVAHPYPVDAELVDGNIVLSCERPVNAWSGMELVLELDGVRQEIWLNGIGDTIDNDSEEEDVPDVPEEDDGLTCWEEVLEELKQGNSVSYTSAYSVTLDTELTLRPGQELLFGNWTDEVSLTIAEGGKLILDGEGENSASVYFNNGSLIVEDGGVLATRGQTEYHAYMMVDNGITVKDGGQIIVEELGGLTLDCGVEGLLVEEGGSVQVRDVLIVGYGWDAHQIAGRVDCVGEQARMELNGMAAIAPTGAVYVSGGAELNVIGGLSVEQGGLLQSEIGNISLSGESENAGTIIINDGTLYINNQGYSVVNSGTIQVGQDSWLEIDSTVLENTGSVTGEGYLIEESECELVGYDTGIEWIEPSDWENQTPWDYSRWAFVRDPIINAEMLYFLGELSNRDGGTCTLETSMG